jgi:hypothetical protein
MTDPSAISNPDLPVRTVHCRTPNEFLDALSRRGYGLRGPLPKHWIFRGHSDDAYQLVPSALRNASEQLIQRSNYPIISDSKTQRFLEICELDEFFKTADSIGLALPEDTQLLRNYLKRARHESDPWPQDHVLSLMALAQHHGVPTRLLDWSRNPLKAALFAASGATQNADKTGRLSVWAFSLALLELCTPSTPSEKLRSAPFLLVTAPSATNSNLHAQEGIFTLAQNIAADESPVDRRSLDEVLGDWIKKYQTRSSIGWFHRVTLPKSEADNLCWELAHEGITQATLFPNFYGVVAAMNDMNRWMRPGGPGYATFSKR